MTNPPVHEDAGQEFTIEPGQTLLVGLASPGMASLTAVNQIVDEYDSTEIGHISPDELPAITPFEDGMPRHHTRLYDLDNVDIVVLLSKLFVPAWAARPSSRKYSTGPPGVRSKNSRCCIQSPTSTPQRTTRRSTSQPRSTKRTVEIKTHYERLADRMYM